MEDLIADFTWDEVCRVCATPKTIVPLKTLFDADGEKARQLKIISGIDVSLFDLRNFCDIGILQLIFSTDYN